jgi:UDP-N-acetylmuramate: L-alanyl-gamma-D-glutamyl-meso-diaminopimelate ligase
MKAYFVGIAGAGMSALASVLASQGYAVCGSDDDVFPPVSTYLERMGIAFHVGFDPARIPLDIDVAIIGASAKLDVAHNVEVAEIARRGAPSFSFAEFLGRHTAQRQNVVIAGSFGKSTLTSLCAVLMREARSDPGYFIGAVPLDLEMTGRWGSDPTFLIEGDEYIVSQADRRSKFLLYHPNALLISSIVHDHVNVFPTMESYEAPFAQLIDLLAPDALLVCARGFEPLQRLTLGRQPIWYGLAPGDGYFAEDIQIGEVTRFRLATPTGERILLETELLGLHNIENIVGAAALLLERGDIDADVLARGVRAFRGVARRLDKKTRTSRVPAYEGFGSSYEKARSAIEAIGLHFPGRPAVVIFEPHTFSWRNAESLTWYDAVFQGVARVLLLAPPTHGANAHNQVSHADILARIRAAGVAAEGMQSGAAVVDNLASSLCGDEVVLLLSSGPLDGLAVSLPQMLEARFGGGTP